MSLLDSLTKAVNQNPLTQIVNKISAGVNALENTLENSVNDLFTKGLKSVGVSSSTAGSVSARFNDAYPHNQSDAYFRISSSSQDRPTPQEIVANSKPGQAETSFSASTALSNARTNLAATEFNGSDTLQYPNNIGKYFLAMRFAEYQRPAPQVKGNLVYENAIQLPIPKNLAESFSIKIYASDQGKAGGIADAIQAGSALLKTGKPGETAEFALNAAAALSAGAVIGMAGEFGEVAAQGLKAVPNPHAAALFNGIDLRTFNFEWTFAPRNADESANIQNIIKRIKQNSLPTYSKLGTAALQYPRLVQINLYPWASDNSEFLLYKPSLIQAVTVNYAPNGIPSFFQGTKLPTFISLGIAFLETEYFTGHDYGAGSYDDNYSKAVEAAKDYVLKNAGSVADYYQLGGISEALGVGASAVTSVTGAITAPPAGRVANPTESSTARPAPAPAAPTPAAAVASRNLTEVQNAQASPTLSQWKGTVSASGDKAAIEYKLVKNQNSSFTLTTSTTVPGRNGLVDRVTKVTLDAATAANKIETLNLSR